MTPFGSRLMRPLCRVVLCLLILPSVARAADIGPLAGRVFGTGTKVSVVLIHGDISSGGPADYLYPHAEALAATHADATVIALLRPGYGDAAGEASPGDGRHRDHYTRENNDLVAAALRAAKRPGSRLVVMGHSGGAAQVGTIIARYPGLVDSAILVSCPCDVPRWREERGRGPWRQSESPMSHVDTVSPGLRVVALTGTRDGNTSTALAEDYVTALRARGIDATFTAVGGVGHGFNDLATAVIPAVEAEMAR